MSEAVELTRNVTREECFWLDRDYEKGTVMWPWTGGTYGACGDGEALTEKPGKQPFHEFPKDAIRVLEDEPPFDAPG